MTRATFLKVAVVVAMAGGCAEARNLGVETSGPEGGQDGGGELSSLDAVQAAPDAPSAALDVGAGLDEGRALDAMPAQPDAPVTDTGVTPPDRPPPPPLDGPRGPETLVPPPDAPTTDKKCVECGRDCWPPRICIVAGGGVDALGRVPVGPFCMVAKGGATVNMSAIWEIAGPDGTCDGFFRRFHAMACMSLRTGFRYEERERVYDLTKGELMREIGGERVLTCP